MFGMRMVAAGLLGLGAAGLVGAQDAQKPAYLNPNLPAEQRAADLVQRMTLEEKASQLVNQARAIPRLGVPAYDWWSEALARRSGERDDGISRAHRIGRDLRFRGDSRDGGRHRHRGTDQARAGGSGERWKQQHLSGAGFLGAEHQHLSRSAMGARAGDLRRRSFFDGADGRGVRDRDAGRRSALLPRDLDAKAFCRALAGRSRRGTSPMWT